MKKLYCQDPNLERVARLGSVNEDRAAHRMRAGAALGDTLLDRFQRFGDFRFGRAGKPEALKASGDHRFDTNAIAGSDTHGGRQPRVVVTPVDVFGRERQVLGSPLLTAADGRNRRQRHDGQRTGHASELTSTRARRCTSFARTERGACGGRTLFRRETVAAVLVKDGGSLAGNECMDWVVTWSRSLCLSR